MTVERAADRRLNFITVTAPGRSEHSLPGGEVCECTPSGGVDLAAWNASHSARWNHLRTLLRREYPGIVYFRGVEVQERGALHDHFMAFNPHGEVSAATVRRLAIRAGFGHSVDVAPCVAGSRKAAYYVSKYVTKACDSRADVPWLGQRVNTDTGEVTVGLVPGRYRTWSCSREWGSTMADVRAAAAVYARRKAAEASDRALADAVALLGDLAGGLVLDVDPRPQLVPAGVP